MALSLAVLLSLLIGYLLGSLPIGYIVGRIYGLDLTKEGSGSTGTTNVLRLIGKKAALFVLIGDFTKGLGAPLIANAFIIFLFNKLQILLLPLSIFPCQGIVGPEGLIMFLAAFACLFGHVKSIWIGWKGGKAVASGVGTVFAFNLYVGLAVALIWVLTVVISRYSSLGALISMPLSPFIMYLIRSNTMGDSPCAKFNTIIFTAYCILGALYIIWKHQANIQRLLTGQEPKVGEKK